MNEAIIKQKIRIDWKDLTSWIALFILLGICLMIRPEFRSADALLKIARQVTVVGIIALGMTFVIAGGGIDLSVGSLFALTGVITVDLLTQIQSAGTFVFASEPEGAFLIAMGISVLIGALGGALNGLLVVFCRIPPFIATLGTYSIYRSLALYLAEGGTDTMLVDFYDIAAPGIMADGKNYELTSLIMVALTAVCWVLLKYTAFGRHVCAVGSNMKVARFAGIHTARVQCLTYVLTGALVGVALVLHLGQSGTISSSDAGKMFELDAIAAVVIGGTAMSGGKANMWGTLAGALILGIIAMYLNLAGTSGLLKDMAKGVIILLSVLLQGITGLVNRDNLDFCKQFFRKLKGNRTC